MKVYAFLLGTKLTPEINNNLFIIFQRGLTEKNVRKSNFKIRTFITRSIYGRNLMPLG